MKKALVKLAYKQMIDATSQGSFEQRVFNDSYQEYRMQVQAYDPEGKYTSWSELLRAVPKAASLHYKVGFAVGLYVRELNNLIPDLQDSLGTNGIPFESHLFHIVESDTRDKAAHKVAITYVTETFTLLDSIGNYLLLAKGDEGRETEVAVETFMLLMQSSLSIVSYQEIVAAKNLAQLGY